MTFEVQRLGAENGRKRSSGSASRSKSWMAVNSDEDGEVWK